MYSPPLSISSITSSDYRRTGERFRAVPSRPSPVVSQIPPKINYKFWFDDLHVVLLSSDHVAFRVRRDSLEGVSDPLNHLIADASKTADKRSSFGCPIVRLDVRSTGLEPFLEVVTDPVGNKKINWLAYRSSPSDEGCLSFSWLAAVARTAHELGACETKFAALSRIMHFFKSHAPLSFATHHGSFQDNWQRRSRECGLTLGVENAIEALNLSRLLFAAPRFPLALYACCLLSPAQLRNGVARTADGVVERLCDDDFDRLVKTFAPADDWECLGAHRSAFPCEGKHGMRKIRDGYIAHMRTPGPYRPDLRDLLAPLKFKSVPYERLFAPGGESLVCRECAKRVIDRSQTLCAEEARNLEKYFFPEQFKVVEDHDANRSPVPNEPETPTPPPESKPESEIEWETESESESKEQSGFPIDVEATPHPLAPHTSSTEKPSSTSPQLETSSQGGSRTSSDRSESPADVDDEPRSTLTSPRSRSSLSSRTSPPPPPRVELGVLALSAIGCDG